MPNFAYDAQVAGQADAVQEVLSRLDPAPLDPLRPVTFTGIGTSMHACRVACYWAESLSHGALRTRAVEAHELALHGQLEPADQLVIVSHRGTKRFTNQLLSRARREGIPAVFITGQGAPEPEWGTVLRTCPDETASTHTVSYLCSLTALALLVSTTIGQDATSFAEALASVPEAIRSTLAMPPPTEAARQLQDREPLLITGFGIDEITAQEAALKIKEGCYLWAEGMSEEFALHGTPAVFEARMGAVVIEPGRPDGNRAVELTSLLRALGLEVVSCGPGSGQLRFEEVPYLLRPLVAIIPLQRLVGALARLRDTNPDLTRGDQEPWKSAVPKVKL